MMTKLTDAEFMKLMSTLNIPDGFKREFSTGSWGTGTFLTCIVSKEDVTFEFCQHGGGHTRFKVGEVWHSFDRIGVEDSFYILDFEDKPVDLNATVIEQFARIEKSREYYKTAIRIPQIGFSTSPEGLTKLKEQLGKQGRITFHPSGFGTGYTISKRKRDSYDKRATKALEDFFAVSPLYVSTMDCD